MQTTNELSKLLAGNPELCDLYFKGLADPGSLTDSERRRFVIVLGTFLIHLVQADQMESAARFLATLLINPLLGSTG